MSGQTLPAAANDDWTRFFNEGVSHFNGGRIPEAATCFSEAARLKPDHPAIQLNFGLALRMQGRRDEAIQALAAAARLRADHPDTLFHLGTLLVEARRLHEALPVFQRLVAIRPDYPEAALNLGNLLMYLDKPEIAEIAYRFAVLADPGSATATNNLGAAIMSQVRPDEAAVFYRRGIRLAPAIAEYHKNLGTCQLMAGNFAEGTRAYEWRSRQPQWRWVREFPGKEPWNGGSLAGRTIFVHWEQGLGDTFQFVRYLMVLKAMGAHTVFECQRPLKRILSCVPGIDRLVAHGEPLPDFDCYVPLMSLPHRCRTTPETIPGGVPYVRAEPERSVFWRSRMDRSEFRIGINWQTNDPARSVPLELFSDMAGIPGVRLYSLQQVVGLEQLEPLRDRLGIVDWSAEMDTGNDGFVDSAAVMSNLDLVISTDSAINHLAGAMGLRAFLVLRHLGDWRWMLRADTPWYPNTRIFRMDRRNDWPGVMAKVTAAVAALAARQKAT